MKKICIVGTIPEGLKTVRSYLREVNAHIIDYSTLESAMEANIDFDLVVLLADKNIDNFKKDLVLLKKDSSFLKKPVLYLLPLALPKNEIASLLLNAKYLFQLPVDKLRFLSSVAELLNIPPRRVFKAIISIRAEENKTKFFGESVDFSETGMAFTCSADFEKEQKMEVGFVNPATRKRMLLNVKVARKIPQNPGDMNFYGVIFSEMKRSEIKELLNFITGQGRR